jgi:hypothetical protein
MRVGRASADASLPPASVRWGAWPLMLGSPVGRTPAAARRVEQVRLWLLRDPSMGRDERYARRIVGLSGASARIFGSADSTEDAPLTARRRSREETAAAEGETHRDSFGSADSTDCFSVREGQQRAGASGTSTRASRAWRTRDANRGGTQQEGILFEKSCNSRGSQNGRRGANVKAKEKEKVCVRQSAKRAG